MEGLAEAEFEALSAERRQRILEGATTVFQRDGYEGASMARIAFAARVSKGTLYNYFPSKAALFAAYVRKMAREHIARIFAFETKDTDPAAILRRVGMALMELALSPLGVSIFRVVVAEAERFPDLARTFYEAGPGEAVRHISALLAREREEGRLEVGDPDFAAEQFCGLCHACFWMPRKLGLIPPPAPEEIARVVDDAIAVFLKAYGKHG